MGLRGPKPTPSAVKMQRGTFRADRAAAHEASPIGRPTCPKWLSNDAKKEFRRLTKLLGEMGLLGAVDQNALARYCSTWVRWRQSMTLLERGGEVVIYKDDKTGKVKAVQPSAFAVIVRGLSEELSRFENAFGMNPSSRSRIEVQIAPPPSTDTSRFFDPPAEHFN